MRTEGRKNPQNKEGKKKEQKISLGQNRADKPGEFKLQKKEASNC